RSTEIIGEKVDWLLSVFKDNAGVIKFNDRINLVYKAETHNTPSALEPYGGALTGIVGVNRDPMGTGLGADLLFNVWGYCFGSPFYEKKMPAGLLHPNRIRENVHKGVIDGGNQSGIPYARGWEYFDERYIGKPLVFCGTVGSMPVEVCGRPTHDKQITPGDLIVMAGGRIGKDGIHGATFSSEELHEDSPIQAVQIGDPITQKKMYDFLIHARNLGLYSFVTDNGAGGLSSSVGEMAQSSGGCYLDLTNAPLKYQGMEPWEILISEAQERMSFAVPTGNKEELFKLADKYGVELTVLGEFTDSGKFHVTYKDETVAYLDMEYLHDGLPQMELDAVWIPPDLNEPEFDIPENLAETLKSLLGRLNICSIEGKSRQYDHEVKGLNIIKPFIGVQRDIPSDATVVLAEHGSMEGIILAEGKNPSFSDIDTYHMAASVIDEAVRRVISTGGSLDHMAGLDNFCWPDPVQSGKTPDGHYKLAQLVRANMALFDYTTAYNVPCISGKDSMKNDCILEGKKISIPPTLLFSVMAKMNDITKAVTMDIKLPGDLVYIAGETFDELGGSEYYRMVSEKSDDGSFTGMNVPIVNSEGSLKLYKAMEKITEQELAHSIHTPTLGGLGTGFAKMVMAGGYGMEIDISKIPVNECDRYDKILFSESNSRFIITIAEEVREKFESVLADNTFSLIGKTIEEPVLLIKDSSGEQLLYANANEMRNSWKHTFKDFFDGSS
ncbi:MAG: phosphoribosylformylglycinamidine synthase, partial [bacterium]|nr:phosphoribosylformylglycinamidine synthase [bacterium]